MKRFRKHYKLLEKKKAHPFRKNKHHKDPRGDPRLSLMPQSRVYPMGSPKGWMQLLLISYGMENPTR